MANLDTWIMVPAYNEATVVRKVIEDLLRTFPKVVVVDDGSADATVDEVRATDARVVCHPMNLGAGAARQTAIEFALRDRRAQYFVTFDADGQHRADDASEMVQFMRENPVDILLGSRFLGAEAIGMSKSKKLLLSAGRVFERFQSGIALTDAHNGLRAFRRNFAQTVKLSMADMAYASELLSLIANSGLPYGEFPVTIDYSDYSKAKGQRSINSVNIATDVLLHRMLKGPRK
ncbi:glycosyltransferase family 2 protein [Antricoccus suffuscus]|uniref:glycosyltransferase family 2 protein n=1 Tax=Antricoccus suffuscus TaxID=1629062 RepID=UPI00192D29D3|nr:glycosyltransferase family 2 protein [Antricoccus suffuscus]